MESDEKILAARRRMSSMESDPHDLCTCGNYRKDHDGRTAATADCSEFTLALPANLGWEGSCAQCADVLRQEDQRVGERTSQI